MERRMIERPFFDERLAAMDPSGESIREVEVLEKNGHVEVVLSGIVGTELWDQRCTVVLSATKANELAGALCSAATRARRRA